MIEGKFDRRTFTNMNVALDSVCENVPGGEDHVVRKRVARQIIKCAINGRTSLGELIAAGQRALGSLGAAEPSVPLERARPLRRA